MAKNIIIKSMHIVNFKGITDLVINFDATETDVFGANGSGKTTIADAFTWLLFKKDSNFDTEFDIKPLDAEGRIIYNLPHEVSAIINVDGEDIALCRRLVEKWPKRDGVPTFTGNKVEQTVNDVPCNENEYKAKIAEICDEDTFKKITSPTFFVSQSSDKQKSDLLKMAGEINDDDIAAGNPEFENLMSMMKSGNKTLDEIKREISAKKSKVNNELKALPGNIDEKKRDIAAHTDDWDAIESEIATVTTERDNADAQLTDINAAVQQYGNERRALSRDIDLKRREITDRRKELTQSMFGEYNDAQSALTRIDTNIKSEQAEISRCERLIVADRAAIRNLESRRERMLNEYRELCKRRDAIAAETLVFDETDFVCPTCHRSFDIADIEAKQAEMTERFENERKSRLSRIKADIESNINAGRPIKNEIADTEANIAATEKEIAERRAKIESLTADREQYAGITKPDVEPVIAADADIIRLTAELADLESRFNADAEPESTEHRDELRMTRDKLNAQLDALKSRLAHRTTLNNDNARLAELESKYRTLNDELTELEHLEYVIGEFSKSKNEAIDARINGMFRVVRFRWIKYRINGDEKETCEATINGVPYASLNTAGKIIAGIDIINAICKFEGITAPIFIDNRESITTDLPPMQSQIVNLIAKRGVTLTAQSHNSITA